MIGSEPTTSRGGRGRSVGEGLQRPAGKALGGRQESDGRVNVGRSERVVCGTAGSLLLLRGLMRRDLAGLLMAGVGGALLYRGASGYCALYEALDIDTAKLEDREQALARHGVRVTQSYLIDKAAKELYAFWRDFENLPQFMTHLQEVQVIDERRSHWIAKAPAIMGGQVEWDAEITADEPNSRIAWRALPGGDIDHRGSITFEAAPGERGTKVRAVIQYRPPAGQVGRWLAKLFGEEPEQQIRDDLRNFKRLMEVGELPTIEGQPRGRCGGIGERVAE